VRGAVVVAVALALAVSWEWLVAHVQGESHFLVQLRQRQGRPVQRAAHLLTQVAGLAPAVALLGLRALGWTARSTGAAGAGVVGGFALLAIVPSQAALLVGSNGKPVLTPSNIVYGLLALLVWGTCARVCLGLLRNRTLTPPDRSLDWFLLVWLTLELGGYFALSPFPAARRVVGLVLVFTLLVGRLAHQRGVAPPTANRVAAFGVALALLFFGTDVLEARAGRIAARELAQRTYRPAEGGAFWHLSWWGFTYYANREGLSPLQLNRQALRAGDLIAVQDAPELREVLVRHPEMVVELLDTVVVSDHFPLRLGPGYYDGRTPMENQRAGRLRILVYRITAVTNK
jgi:protein-S-isoprenylcysteine O-methyltransferase Ste14